DFYLNHPSETVKYSDKGSVAENGAYTVSFFQNSGYYLSTVDYLLMKADSNGTYHILCSDKNIIMNQKALTYQSNFKGLTLALDGHRMFFAATRMNDVYSDYSTPVILNGKRITMHYSYEQYFDGTGGGYYLIFGLWNDYDENGLPDGDYRELKKGDKVQVLTEKVIDGGRTVEKFSEEFTIGENGGKISALPLDGKTYRYVFVATDIFGNTFTSDMATFEMTKNYEELLKDPLPDGEFAAKVTAIEPCEAEDIP
ncbi:MAG: hypothetical protein IJL81_01780, partial [Clostridia bacterium]|nr:hypothetical protein [Clostridia bacterium]